MVEPAGVALERGLADLDDGRWSEAEQRLTSALTRTVNDQQRTSAVVGIAHARIVGRLDPRAAFPMLQSLVSNIDEDDPHLAIRIHVVAAHLFASPDAAVHDRQRHARHLAGARSLLAANPHADLSAQCAVAELFGTALLGDARTFVATEHACKAELGLAHSPVSRCLVAELDAISALAVGDLDRELQSLQRARVAARSIHFHACEARLLGRLARRALESGAFDDALGLVNEATAALASAGVAMSWVHLALAEARRRAVERERSTPHAFAHAAAGVRALTTQLPPLAPEPSPPSLGPARHGLDDEVTRLAPSRATVLVVGGLASVQAFVARTLHDRSPRAQGPFVTVDCVSLDAAAAERVLFGGPSYVRHASGAIHAAEGGTLYISGVHAMPPSLQPRLLTYLDGAQRARVVASTDVDLRDLVDEGAFRRDLGERLELVRVVLAPLR